MIYASWIYFDGWIHKKPWCIIIFSCRPLISMFCWSLWWSLTGCSDHQTLSSGPRLETRDSGHRDSASLGGFCGCCRLPDGGISWWWSEQFRCWLTLNSHLLSHCALTLVTVFAQLIISLCTDLTLSCYCWVTLAGDTGLYLAAVRFRLSWDSLEAAERAGASERPAWPGHGGTTHRGWIVVSSE